MISMISTDFIETCSGRLRWLLAVLGAGDGALLDDGALEVVVDVAELARGRLVVLQVVAAARQDVGAGVGKVGHAAVHILALNVSCHKDHGNENEGSNVRLHFELLKVWSI